MPEHETKTVSLRTKNGTYRWHEDWVRLEKRPDIEPNERTHGVEVTRDGRLIVFAQTRPAVRIYAPDGELLTAWGTYDGAHGLTLVEEDGEERLWLTDQYSAAVVKTTMDGKTLQSIPAPAIADKYAPTWVAVSPADGSIWVTDGYGSNVIRRYASDGTWIGELTGAEGAGAFSCPHGIAFGPDGKLYVADRGNHRIAVYDASGNYLYHNDRSTHSPCSFSFADEGIYVPELFGSAKRLDYKLSLLDELGANPDLGPNGQKPTVDGWPNLRNTEYLVPGRFNSPHDVAAAPNGDIYVAEWIVGGRVTRLQKVL